jgi:hypothetical protein
MKKKYTRPIIKRHGNLRLITQLCPIERAKKK